MKYDFSTMRPRIQDGSEKWLAMKELNPNLSPEIVPLSVADMEFPTPPQIVTELKSFLDRAVLGYTIANDTYLDALYNWQRRRNGWEIEKDWVVVSPGVVPALCNAVRTLTQEGDGVILMSPVYFPFFRAIEQNGRVVADCPLIKGEKLRYTIDYEMLEKLCSEKRNTMLMLCSPHNPVGRVWTKEELKKVGEICLAHDVFVVADEIHSDLIMAGHRHTPFASISTEFANHSITCTAPSKTFNLAGLQVSNILIPDKTVREKFLAGFAQMGLSSINIMGLKGCEIAYNQCEDWLEELIEVISENKKLVEDFMAKRFPTVAIAPMEGTYLLWLDFSSFDMNKEQLECFMQQKAQLYLDEGYIFGEKGAGFERINLACPPRVLIAALDRLDKAAKEIGK